MTCPWVQPPPTQVEFSTHSFANINQGHGWSTVDSLSVKRELFLARTSCHPGLLHQARLGRSRLDGVLWPLSCLPLRCSSCEDFGRLNFNACFEPETLTPSPGLAPCCSQHGHRTARFLSAPTGGTGPGKDTGLGHNGSLVFMALFPFIE